jgi:hypothetical protein
VRADVARPHVAVTRPRSGPGLANWTRAAAKASSPPGLQGRPGRPGGGGHRQGAGCGCHGHIVQGQRAAVPRGERNGHAIAAEVDCRQMTGNGSVIGHPADEPRRSTEVVEVEGLLDAVPVAFGASAQRSRPRGARGFVLDACLRRPLRSRGPSGARSACSIRRQPPRSFAPTTSRFRTRGRRKYLADLGLAQRGRVVASCSPSDTTPKQPDP